MKRPQYNLALFAFLAGLVLLAACGARNELPGGSSALPDAGAPDDAGLSCPLGESTHRPGHCVCDPDHLCPAGDSCCEPIHITDDFWPMICVVPGDNACEAQAQ